MDSNRRLSDDYHVNLDYQQEQPPAVLPKVRQGQSSSTRKPPTVAPATPRMMRNTSGSVSKQLDQQQQQSLDPHKYSESPFASGTPASPKPPAAPVFLSPAKNDTDSAARSNLPPLDTQATTPTKLLPAVNVNQQHGQQGTQTQPGTASGRVKRQQQPFHRHSIGEWDFAKTIGAGSMGKVKLARHRRTNEICAIKIVPRAARLYLRTHENDPPPVDAKEAQQRQKEYDKEIARDKRTIREASLGKILYHPFICRLFEVVTMSNHYYMLFEYVSGGQMLDYIVSHGSLKERHARKFARGVASALEYLHGNNIVHRDLKIENIMISKTGDIKIIDFGLSNLYSNQSLLKTFCGSLYFAAPELLCAHPYIGPEVDVWSFGVVLYVLVCGKVPFDDQSVPVLHEKIKKGNVEYPDYLSSDVVSLLSRMLVVNPQKRAKLDEIIAHPWITKGFEGAPSSFIPYRTPLKLPLDNAVVKEMFELDFGESEENIRSTLVSIINSPYYEHAAENWYLYKKDDVSQTKKLEVDPTVGFHPLISLYYLVDEMLKRKSAKKSIVDIPSTNVDPERSNQLQDLKDKNPEESKAVPSSNDTAINPVSFAPRTSKIDTPKPPPILSFPEAAHTSPNHPSPPLLPSPADDYHVSTNGEILPAQQVVRQHSKSKSQTTNEDSKGFNSIFRKFSQRRVHSQRRATEQNKIDDSLNRSNNLAINVSNNNSLNINQQDSLVRRVGSLNLARKPPINDAELRDNSAVDKTRTHNRTVSAYSGQAENQNQIPKANNTTLVANNNKRKFHPSARAKSVGNARQHPAFKSNNSNEASSSSQRVPPLPSDLNDEAFFDDVTLDDFSPESNNDKVTLVDSTTSSVRHSNSRTGATTYGLTDLPNAELNETQILEEAAKAPQGSMPSIEYPRTMFLKGFFSVQTTSTKPLPIIRANVISVLTKLGVQFTEVRGGFVCIHTPSIQPAAIIVETPSKSSIHDETVEQTSSNSNKSIQESTGTTQHEIPSTTDGNSSIEDNNSLDRQSTPTSISKSHRRKFSIGGSILGYRRKQSTGAPAIPPTPIAASHQQGSTQSSSPIQRHGSSTQTDFDSSASLDSLNLVEGGSDMLVSSRIAQNEAQAQMHSRISDDEAKIDETLSGAAGTTTSKTSANVPKVTKTRSPLKFEIHIVKIPLVGLYGVQFKKVSGNAWMYKALAGQILSELKL